MTAPTPDRTPTGDLRDRIAEALLAGRCCTGHIPRLADAVLPVVEAETAALRERAEKLQCQVNGYRGMKDRYLRERNAAHDELIEAENLIELLCNDREAGQRVAKAALTEQRQRADEAERQRDEALAAVREFVDGRPCNPHPGNGWCQTHGERAPCPHAAAKKLLAAVQPEHGEEQAAPVDWEATVRQGERELKRVGEARHQAEAAVQRVRDLAEAAKRDTAQLFARQFGGAPFPATLRADDVLAALDQPEETPDA